MDPKKRNKFGRWLSKMQSSIARPYSSPEEGPTLPIKSPVALVPPPEDSSSPKGKTVARDILLAFIPLGVAQGYSMSGFPPTIVGACVCWALTAALLFHAAWVGVPIHSRWIRGGGVALIAVVLGILMWNPVTTEYKKEHGGESRETATAIKSSYFHISLEYMRTDWGKPYNPKTLMMAYYLLNNRPTLSPIDIWAKLRITNLTPDQVKIDSLSFETGPTSDGPWMSLIRIPSGNHMGIYVVGSLKNEKSHSAIFEDISDQLNKPLGSKDETTGWILEECPSNPPCLGWDEKVTIKTSDGKSYSEIESLADYNAAAAKMQKTDPTSILVPAKNPGIDLSNVELLRPFPTDAYAVPPDNRGSAAQLFRSTQQ